MGQAELLSRARKLVAEADKWRASANRVLTWATIAVETPGNKLTDDALALVDRCFKINERSGKVSKAADLVAIKAVFANVAAFFAEVIKGNEYLNVGPPIRPNDIAYANVGGWAKKDKSGLTFVLAQCQTKKDLDLTDIIMHESIHFAGGIGHFDIGGDPSNPAYGAKVFTLTNAQAKTNASSYAYFAYISRLQSSQWATAT